MTPHDIRWKQRFQNYTKAYQQLKKAVALPEPDIFQQQGIIQCFEYTFELAWKTLQDYLSEISGYNDIRGPRPVLEQAYQDNLIKDGVMWLEMLKSRNLTSHLYDESEVQKVLIKIRQNYYPLFTELTDFFTNKIQ